jgi:glc operon protein GlcG
MRTKPCLTSADAQKMMAACKAEAEKNKWNVSIAIVDDAGVLLLLERMDGAGPTTPEVAHGKGPHRRVDEAIHEDMGGPREGAAGVLELSRRPRDLGRRSHHLPE